MIRRQTRTAVLFMLITIVLSASFLFSIHYSLPIKEIRPNSVVIRRNHHSSKNTHLAISTENEINRVRPSISDPITVSVLLPDWEVLLLISPDSSSSFQAAGGGHYCLFHNNETSPAKPAGILPSTKLATFQCHLPRNVRRNRSLLQPILTKQREVSRVNSSESPKLLRWSSLAYESISTEKDVILFAKGVNYRQGSSRSPAELRCLFGGDDFGNGGVLTNVTSSLQEVFRCHHPDENALAYLSNGGNQKEIKVSLQFQSEEKEKVLPSVAYYTHWRKPAEAALREKSLICACTMVYNVGKFLKEWVLYHSKLGVEKFFLYDNGSGDALEEVVAELLLRRESYNNVTIEILSWPWPKTQEAGFSHCALHARDSCSWMAYIDVDEFIFSPSWINSSEPSTKMLKSLLPSPSPSFSNSSDLQVGQIGIQCLEFGPSNQISNPVQGVTQGYTCRRRADQRHKSMVLLEAVDESLMTVIHHFRLKEGYGSKWLSLREGVVNHYKYQVWPEFKNKFRRRVSAYVADWRDETNPNSKDRTPGLGFLPVQPDGWANKFCEVNDTRLKELTKRWFGLKSRTGFKMAWQDG